MAYANWAHPTKNGQPVSGGNGNDTISWHASPNTGRNLRTTKAVFSASGVEDKELTINQYGAAEFVNMDDTAAVSKTGGTLTISGWSNSSKLTFALTGTDNIGLTLPSSYTAAGATVNNGAAIPNDPGAGEQYPFSITFTGIVANPGVTALVSQLTVTDNAGHTDTCTITQAAGDATLSISPATITLAAEGTPAQSVDVTSNTNWSIS